MANALSAEPRTETGKGAARKLRAAGRIPAVLYGKSQEPQALTVDPEVLDAVLHASGAGLNTLIELEVSGSTETVLVKELQREPVRGEWLHADFYHVDMAQKVTVSVPIHLVGKAAGVDLGGILDHPIRDLEIQCLPGAIPEFVEVDVTALELGQSIHVGDMTLPAGVEVQTDESLAVASVVAPKEEVEEEPVVEEGEEGAAEGEEGAEASAEAGGGDAKASEGGDDS